jgi:hypothetical protein
VGGIGLGSTYSWLKVTMDYLIEELELEREAGSTADGLERGTSAEALNVYQSLLGQGSAVALVECADALRSFDMNDEALAAYGEAIARDTGCLAAYLGRGELFFEEAVLGVTRDEGQKYGLRAVTDFREGMLASLGSVEVVWKLGTALLLVGDAAGAHGLAENVLMKSEVVSEGVRRDFLYLLGFAKLFSGDPVGAGVCAAELVSMEGDAGEGGFLELAISIFSPVNDGPVSDGAGCSPEKGGFGEAGQRLQLSGCRDFLDIARALAGVCIERKG